MSAPSAPDAGKTSAWLRELLAERLGIASDAIEPDARLHRYGLTSLTAASIVVAIAERTGRLLAPTLIWDYPTLNRLEGFLDGRPDAGARPEMVPLAADEPIAIVGMACRLPGAESLDAFWQMLGAETDAIREVPAARWPIDRLYDPDPLAPGRMATRWGGFLERVDEFDAAFFGMSPREATQADPQQRLALELAWESLEDAAIRPSRLLGSRTGVFLGAMWSDYARLLTDRDGIAQHTATGQDISIISARIAYTLGLEGPALTIDTACSSALVAVHQACQSLRTGETTMALAGGVHLLLAPESSIAMTKFGAMAPDGRCKAFDSRANGYVRGEGGGIVVLKPLSAARADGDRVYAVIRGSAMNNDGPSNGLTAPNPAAQRGMLRDALAAARVHPHEVDYVEAHGTGTALGDPIEANALAAVLCADRPEDRPLRIGSVKTNIGHLEAAAGAAGLIKLALALRHRWIPASLHFRAPNPAIDFAAARLELQAKGSAWPTPAELPIAGVSSFGFGGTNCHVLLQAVPAQSVASMAGSARPVFVFAGNGGNWSGMAQGLMQEPVFASALQDCDRTLSALGYPASVLAVLQSAQVGDVALGQPALCAFQLALVDLLKSWGVMPAAVIGHSVGEAAAAVASGALSRGEGLRLVVERSRLQAEVSGKGGMALAGAPAEALRRHLPAGVVIAGENGPRATLLAGTKDAINAACAALDRAGIVSQPIDVPVAYHSPQMDALQPTLRERLSALAPVRSTTPMVSTVTGTWIEGATLDAAYWARNLREPVCFRQGVAALIDGGHRTFLELAPHPLLAPQLRQMAAGATVVSPVRRDAATATAARAALAPLLHAAPATETAPSLLVLSARSPSALEALARRWAERLPSDWTALCHTALIGRERFEHRLALHAPDGEAARRRLLAGDYLRGRAARNAAIVAQRADGEATEAWLDRCAIAFVAGADIDATDFDLPQVVSAPTYPFERERHWLGGADTGLSYDLAWESSELARASFDLSWPDTTIVGDAVDPGLDVEAVTFARAALATVPVGDVDPRHRALVERLATWQPLSGPSAVPGPARDLLRRVGEALPAVLKGEIDPIEILFPGGDIARTAPVYAAAPFAAAQKALAEIIGKVAGDRGLHLLELGAGTGALTAQLLPALPAGSTLVCSDVSMAFLATLRQRFADSTALRTAEFDLDRPAGQQGPFDAIVAANVVHAASLLGTVLVELRKRLAPGGVLGLVELVRAPRWIDLVFGITDGWWRFRGDPTRAQHALLDIAAWRKALAAAGFVDIDIRTDGDAHAVVLARAPATECLWRADDRPAAALVDDLAALVADPATASTPLAIVHGTSVAHAAVAGATRALSLDHPHRIARSIELADSHEDSLATLRRLLDANILGLAAGEEQFRVQEGALQVARLVRTMSAGIEPAISPHLIYVIAGGFGRLGRLFARFLVDRGARHILLVGRSTLSAEQLSALRHNDVVPRSLALDLAAPGAADALRAALDRPLGGLIHAAGRADGPTAAVLAAKLDIAITLERAADGQSPAFLLLFSSAAGVWGASGHVAYAAANRALDRWAEDARRRGVPATSIAFGRFEEPGLLSAAEDTALDRSGLLAMRPDEAFAAALAAVGAKVANRVVASVDWPRFRATFEARRQRRLFDRVAPSQPAIAAAALPRGKAAPVRLDRTGLAALVAELLGHADPARIDPDKGLFEQGMDSLLAVSFRRQLEDAAGVPVPAAIMFAHPTLNLLADWLAGVARVVPAATAPSTASAEPIAIVGMGCRFAGGADTPAAYLARLMTGLDAIDVVPGTRPTAALWRASPAAVQRAGFLDGVERFAAAFFGISPREAVQLDPQQRLLLEVAWHALENARIAPASLEGTRAGVFVGATGSDYAGLARARGGATLDAHSLTGQPSNTLAGRLAYQFGVHGPALTVDTACSSSLVALHLAVRALRNGEADLALAGGVNLLLTPDISLMLNAAGLLAADGRCKVFDEQANGYVRGEGCGVVVLKRLSEALRDGDRILSTIRGSALNHDGRSSSFTAPNGAAQAAVIRDALADAGLTADAIDCIEAHGTGTGLGDPIELDALTEVFAGRTRRLPVGSVKAAIGHTEAAAGIAAVIKMVLCLRAGALPPQPHFTRRNPHARTDSVVDVAIGGPLPASARYAGVSAFGASGTNAHIVLDRGEPSPADENEPPLTLFDRQAFWLPDGASTASLRHATLGEPHRSARSGETVWQSRFGPDAPWLGDHVVEQSVIMPAAGFLDMARRAGIAALTDVEFRAALDVPSEGIDVQLVRDRQGVLTLYAARGEGWIEIATARIGDATTGRVTAIEPVRNAPRVPGAEIEHELVRRGFGFGPSYRLVETLSRTATVAVATLLAASEELDPPTIDAALQTLTCLLPPDDVPLLPARIGRVVFGPFVSPASTARARLVASAEGRASGHAILETAAGEHILSLHDVELRAQPAEPGAWFHDLLWRPAAAPTEEYAGHWHAIGPGAAAVGTATYDETGAAPIPACDGIVDLRPLTQQDPAACIGAVTTLVREAATHLPRPQLVLVSRGASAAPPVLARTPSAASVLMGLQPIVDAEHPDLRCRWIDLDPDDTALPKRLAGPAGRYAIRQGRLLTPELVKAPSIPRGPVRLAPGPERSFSDLQFLPLAPEVPAAGEVRIAVAAAGLNFKDVLAILGRMDGTDTALGLECAGTIVAVGAGVRDLAVGDAVLAFGPGALASAVTLPANRVMRRPERMDVDVAASLPVACLTAWHGLHDIAAIKPGMRVLVHAGAGGVGSMATAIARLAGARVFATASSGKEQAALLAGADAVGDSRSPAFADTARRWAGADGFDIVLNALGPEIAVASAALLKPDGIFLEIGNAPAPAGVKRHVAYDLDGPMRADPAWFTDRMAKILALVGDGRLAPPRRTVLPLAQTGEALQALGQGRTVGKLVLRVPAEPTIRTDATYLVTGGTGGVGRALAGWLADKGAGRVVLASRRAAPNLDARFETVALDVSDANAVAALLARLHNLRGVIHAAGIVSDSTLALLEPSRIIDVLAPKAGGAHHLDMATRGLDLDFFVLVSSTAGSLASPGQAAYAGANAALDALAATRRAAGLPASAIAFGPWAAGMYTALNAAARARLERDGFRPMAPRRATAAFAHALADGTVHRLVMDRADAATARARAVDGIARTAVLAVPLADRCAFLQTDLEQRLVSLLGFPTGTKIAPTRALRDLGLDSLLAVSLRNELAAGYALDLQATVLFDHPTLAALATHLLQLVEPAKTVQSDTDGALDDLDEAALAALVERELAATP